MPETLTVSPDLGQMVDDALRRVAMLEQRITSPAYTMPNGSQPTFPIVNIGDWQSINTTNPTLPISGESATPTALVLSTGSVFEDIYIDASWTAPVAGTAVEYEVQIAKKVSGVYSIVSATRTLGTSIRIHNLDANSTYGVRIYAVNRIGVLSTPLPASGYTDQATSSDSTIPAQVTGLVATAGMSSVLLTWTDNTEPDVVRGNGLYRLQYATDAAFTTDVVTRLVSGTLASVVGLTAGTTYYFHVLAMDASGNEGAYSATASATPGQPSAALSDGNAPTSSPTPTVIGGATFLFAKWAATTNADPVTYEVHISTSSGFAPNAGTKVAETDATNVFLKTDAAGSALVYGTTYYIRLIAKDRDGSAAAGVQGSGTMAKLSGDTDLVAGSITAASGVIGSLDAGVISTGVLSANRVGANSIDASKLTIATFSEDLVPNGAFEDVDGAGVPTSWTAVTGTFGSTASIALIGTRSAQLTMVAGVGSVDSRAIPVEAGKQYSFGVQGRIGTGSMTNISLVARWLDAAGTLLSSTTVISASPTVTSTTYESTVFAPSNATQLVVRISGTGTTGATLVFDAVRAQKSLTSVQIGNGAVTANQILANSIATSHISTSGLDAGVITFGTMSGDRIQTNTLDATVIKTSSITSSTITLSGSGAFKVGGPGLTGQYGMLIDAQGIRIYDNSGNGIPVIHLNATNGSGVFKGDITGSTGTFTGTLSGGSVIGATITGGLFQTSANTSVARLAIDAINYYGYPVTQITFFPNVAVAGNIAPAYIRTQDGLGGVAFGQDLMLNSGRGSNTGGTGGAASYLTLRPGYGGSAGFLLDAPASYGAVQAGGELRLYGGLDASASETKHDVTITAFNNGDVRMSAAGVYVDSLKFTMTNAGTGTAVITTGGELPTTASAANVFYAIGGSGNPYRIFRFTSSLRYKVDVRPMEEPLWGLLDLVPFRYKGTGELEREGTSRDFIGLAAEDVDALGLYEIVEYEYKQGLPDALMYDRIAPLLLPIVKNLKQRLEALESR